jgi:hypothetical protein
MRGGILKEKKLSFRVNFSLQLGKNFSPEGEKILSL